MRLTVVRRRNAVAFLTSLAVDELDSLVDGSLSLLVTHHFHAVNRADERVFASFRVRESHRVGPSLVGDQGVDLAGLIWMSLLVHGHAHELMRRDVVVEPLQGVLRESLPISITTAHVVSARGGVAHLIGIPDGLAPGVANVLGGATDGNDVRHEIVDLEVVSVMLLLFPRLLVLESVKLDVVEWSGTGYNGSLAIKECQDLVTLLDVVLVGGDGDDLVPGDVVFSDPCLQVA